MSIPTREEAQQLLEEHVKDEYQRHHAKMVGTAVEGYAEQFGGDKDVWYLTGLLHDIDFEEHPDKHPAESLKWFKEWGYPPELIQAVEAHAYGYNVLDNATVEARRRLNGLRRNVWHFTHTTN